MNLPGGWELILVVLVILLVFGAKRLPDSARALGRSMRILKAETKGLRDDDLPTTTATHVVEPVVTPQPVSPAVQPYAGQPVYDAHGNPVAVPTAPVQAAEQVPHKHL